MDFDFPEPIAPNRIQPAKSGSAIEGVIAGRLRLNSAGVGPEVVHIAMEIDPAIEQAEAGSGHDRPADRRGPRDLQPSD
ncbi:MAG: hypothetical protein K2X91_04905 [Thermoleophilia bacterium]|nr:hypothetical protein [Thermoleophilia bacterium]